MVNKGTRKSVKWESAAAKRLIQLAGGGCSAEEAVVRIVRDLLSDVEHPPTNLEALQPKLNIVGVEAQDIPFSGELRSGADGFTVIYSKHLAAGPRRFTIAHEMAHALFASTGKGYPRAGKEVERLCDMLAAELLMPDGAFNHILPAEVTLPVVAELARTFRTSWWATAIRCAGFRRVGIFESDGKVIQRSAGFVRRELVSRLDRNLQDVIARAAGGVSGQRKVCYKERGLIRQFVAEFQPVGVHARVLLRPTPLL